MKKFSERINLTGGLGLLVSVAAFLLPSTDFIYRLMIFFLIVSSLSLMLLIIALKKIEADEIISEEANTDDAESDARNKSELLGRPDNKSYLSSSNSLQQDDWDDIQIDKAPFRMAQYFNNNNEIGQFRLSAYTTKVGFKILVPFNTIKRNIRRFQILIRDPKDIVKGIDVFGYLPFDPELIKYRLEEMSSHVRDLADLHETDKITIDKIEIHIYQGQPVLRGALATVWEDSKEKEAGFLAFYKERDTLGDWSASGVQVSGLTRDNAHETKLLDNYKYWFDQAWKNGSVSISVEELKRRIEENQKNVKERINNSFLIKNTDVEWQGFLSRLNYYRFHDKNSMGYRIWDYFNANLKQKLLEQDVDDIVNNGLKNKIVNSINCFLSVKSPLDESTKSIQEVQKQNRRDLESAFSNTIRPKINQS